MSVDGCEITLDIAGLGIVFHSPAFATHIAEGEDYFSSNYTSAEQVQAHIQKGTIVGFCTGAPGIFILRFHSGYPDEDWLSGSEFKLRLGLQCTGGLVCFRDLYELMDWRAECPLDRRLQLNDGSYHVTLCSNQPPSGILGDNQIIDMFLHRLDVFPQLADIGVPSLCV